MNPQVPADGLVLGTLALQYKFITADQLADALQQWLREPAQSLGQHLVQRGYLAPKDELTLKSLVAQHLERPVETVGPEPRPLGGAAAHTIRQSPLTEPADATRSFVHTLRERRTAAGLQTSALLLTELNSSNQRFKLLRPHAVGGLGMVSVAHDAELDREVAIKEMRLDSPSDDAVGRFMMEARLTGQLDHPGIPPVYALGYFEDGRPFYAMRLIDGATLKEAVADFHRRFPPPDQSRERSLDLRKLLGAFVSVCHTLRYAHSRHVLHRDIKPSNIMLGGFGETLVLDWGLAKSKEQSLPYSPLDAKAHQSRRRTDDPTLTGTGSVMGTPHYMSPEQARGEWESVNLRSEVYSLGATLYTLLTGKLPFSGLTRDEVLEQVRLGHFKRPRSVDARIAPELDAICSKAMALEREDRFANAGELATEIEHWLADEPIRSYQETTSRRWQRWLKSHQSAVAALVALLVTGMIGLAMGMVAVSLEHRLAKTETARAEEAHHRADRSERAARDFVAKFLVLTYNSELAQIPGSELPRLGLMNEAVEQLTSWVNENPDDRLRKFDLAAALRQRAALYKATNQSDKAWSDLTQAIACIDEVGPASLHSTLVPSRLCAVSDLTELVAEKYGAGAAADFIGQYQWVAQKLFDQNAANIEARIALSLVNIRQARSLTELGRYVEASELVDGAVTLCELMRVEPDEAALGQAIHNARQTVSQLTYVGRSLQAQIAADMGDTEYAIQCARRAKELSEEALEESPDGAQPLMVKLEAMALEIELDQLAQNPREALKATRLAAEEAHEVSARFPRHRPFEPVCGRIALLHAEQELNCGTIARAALAASHAISRLSSESDQANSKVEPLLWFAQAHRLSAEIALIQSDPVAALSHCHAARAALEQCEKKKLRANGQHTESQLLDWVEYQATCLQ